MSLETIRLICGAGPERTCGHKRASYYSCVGNNDRAQCEHIQMFTEEKE